MGRSRVATVSQDRDVLGIQRIAAITGYDDSNVASCIAVAARMPGAT
jgi:hypothetical protein